MASLERLDQDISDILISFTHRRISRVAMYFLLFAGSVVSIFAPSEILLQQSSSGLTRAWSCMFAVAAVSCFFGSLFDRWIVEYVFIPLLASILIVFGVALFASSFVNHSALVVPYSMFFGAFSFGLFARWRDVQLLQRVAVTVSTEKK